MEGIRKICIVCLVFLLNVSFPGRIQLFHLIVNTRLGSGFVAKPEFGATHSGQPLGHSVLFLHGVLKHKNKDILYPPHRLLIEHILRCEWKYVIKPQNEGVGKEDRHKDALEAMSSSCEDASTRCCRVLAARCLQFSPTTCQASCSYFYCCFWHIAHAYCSPPFSLISVILGCLELFLTHISVPIKEYG